MEKAGPIAASPPIRAGLRTTVPALGVSLALHGAVAAAALWWPFTDTPASLNTAAVEIVFWAEPAGTQTPALEPPMEFAMVAPPSPLDAPPIENVPPPPAEEAAPSIVEEAPAVVELPPPPRIKPPEAAPRRVARPAPTPPVERPPVVAPAPAQDSAATGGTSPNPASAPSPVADAPTQLASVSPPSGLPVSPPLITQARFRSPPAPPAYPRRAVDLGQEGEVVIRALVGVDGESREIRIFRSSGVALLDEAALRAVKRWAFEAAQINGRAIEAWVEVPVRFQLRTVL
jgi:protein TonB